MPESPNLTLMSESRRHLGEVVDIWRHEGLKKGAENLLHFAGGNALASTILEHLDGGVITDPRLATNLGGIDLQGPIGVGPGWDKRFITAKGWQHLGMRFLTGGGVTFMPQDGLAMPRLRTFDDRIGDHGTTISLNALGFNSPGIKTVIRNLAELRDQGLSIPIIGQVTVNKEYYLPENRKDIPRMIATTIRLLAPYVNGISLGLSSPNTFGMREAQDQADFINSSMGAAREATELPLEYKADGDGGTARLDVVVEAAIANELNIIALINSTALAAIKAKYGAADMPGGLAGGDRQYMDLAVDSVRYVYEAAGGQLDVHGLGGVGYGESPSWQALRLLKGGASAVSVVTGIRPLKHRSARTVERGILKELDDNYPKVTNLGQIVGIDTKRGSKIPLAA